MNTSWMAPHMAAQYKQHLQTSLNGVLRKFGGRFADDIFIFLNKIVSCEYKFDCNSQMVPLTISQAMILISGGIIH